MKFVLALSLIVLFAFSCAQAAHNSGADEASHAISSTISAAKSASHAMMHLASQKSPPIWRREYNALQTCAQLLDDAVFELNMALATVVNMFEGDYTDDGLAKQRIKDDASVVTNAYQTCKTNLRDVRARPEVQARADDLIKPVVSDALRVISIINKLKL